MRCEVDSNLFRRLDIEVRGLLSVLRSGESPDLGLLTRTAGATLEYMLGDAFAQHDAAYRYWVDGVLIDAVVLASAREVLAKGRAWCADHRQQWSLPAKILIALSDEQPSTVSFVKAWLGDAAAGDIKAHRAGASVVEPDAWLYDFELCRPITPALADVEALMAQLRDWTTANSGRPVVGPDWQPLTQAEARQYITSRIAEGRAPSLEEEWLDGGQALRVS